MEFIFKDLKKEHISKVLDDSERTKELLWWSDHVQTVFESVGFGRYGPLPKLAKRQLKELMSSPYVQELLNEIVSLHFQQRLIEKVLHNEPMVLNDEEMHSPVEFDIDIGIPHYGGMKFHFNLPMPEEPNRPDPHDVFAFGVIAEPTYHAQIREPQSAAFLVMKRKAA